MKKDIIWGIITGTLLCLWIVGEYFAGLHHAYMRIGEYSGYVASVIPVITIYLAIMAKRKTNIDERIDIWQGLGSGLVISLFSAVMVTAFMLAYKKYIDPGYDQRYADWKISSMLANGRADYEIKEKLRYLENVGSTMYYIMGIVVTVVLGLSVALAESIFIIFRDNKRDELSGHTPAAEYE